MSARQQDGLDEPLVLAAAASAGVGMVLALAIVGLVTWSYLDRVRIPLSSPVPAGAKWTLRAGAEP